MTAERVAIRGTPRTRILARQRPRERPPVLKRHWEACRGTLRFLRPGIRDHPVPGGPLPGCGTILHSQGDHQVPSAPGLRRRIAWMTRRRISSTSRRAIICWRTSPTTLRTRSQAWGSGQ
jgi:hypothetical protein